jgi:hypothetical protein
MFFRLFKVRYNIDPKKSHPAAAKQQLIKDKFRTRAKTKLKQNAISKEIRQLFRLSFFSTL